jgi:peptide/nickel transport system substrate-binding protein
MRFGSYLKAAAGLALAASLSLPVFAQDLSVGLAAPALTADPHFQNHGATNGFSTHVFDKLVHQDEKQRLIPGLALSWKAIDDTTWEFKLRQDVKFHDGSAFDAQDVVASLSRVPWVPNSPSSFAVFTRAIKETQVVDPFTIQFKTAAPYPLLPNDLVAVAIVSRKQERSPTVDFTSGVAAIGTGPYKLVSFTQGDRIVLSRNDNYWGQKPHWKTVTLRFITNNAARVAALLAGDVQIIENVPSSDIKRLEGDKSVRLDRSVSNLFMYVHLDSFREKANFVKDASGKELANNPFKDPRVREALSLAIDRNAIVERVMEGQALAAAGPVPEGFFGYNPALKVDPYDQARAKKLLADAGYPNGFQLTIHGPNDRFLNDGRILQTLGAMFTRIGVTTKVEAMPLAAFLPPASHPNYEYSALLLGWNTNTGEASGTIRGVLATVDRDRGWGPSNRGRYSNPQLDKLLGEALSTVNDAKREKLLQEASELGMKDHGVLPLYHEISVWAMRNNIRYKARADQFTLAYEVEPAK